MKKMRTKEEIIEPITCREGDKIEHIKLRQEFCKIETSLTIIDIRDILDEIRGELEEMNRLRRIQH